MNIRFRMAAGTHQSSAVLLVYAEIGFDVFKIYFHQRFGPIAAVKYAANTSTLNRVVDRLISLNIRRVY